MFNTIQIRMLTPSLLNGVQLPKTNLIFNSKMDDFAAVYYPALDSDGLISSYSTAGDNRAYNQYILAQHESDVISLQYAEDYSAGVGVFSYDRKTSGGSEVTTVLGDVDASVR